MLMEFTHMYKRENTVVNACVFSIFLDQEWYYTYTQEPPWHLLILGHRKVRLKIVPLLLKYNISTSK